ncbi:MAG: hypothetical protein HYV09_09345 [Deltaproteobacteria bacterium]|nr:hypothetical protein [Deltaproteobacteria bacterium]
MRVVALLSILAVSCVAGGGDTAPDPKDAASSDTTDDTTGNDGSSIFPVEDAAAFDDASTSDAVDTGSAVADATTCGVAGKPCCAGDACGTGSYCFAALCWNRPTATEEGSDPGRCSDLGKTHVSPAFFARYTVRGRPSAKAYRYYVKVSCGSAPPSLTPESPLTIGADGTYTFTMENTATTDCANANLGRYGVWFVVDGIETAHQLVTAFNSTCTSVATCAAAATACP